MKIRAGALRIALCAMIFIGLLGGCESRSYPRVRMTATVESDGVRYSGSSVQEYLCTPSTHLMNDLDKCSVRGEAVVVDIKGKGLLFLIFDMPGARSITEMPRSVLGAVTSDPLHATNATLPKHWALQVDQMPLMVKFRDINDGYTVQQVDPEHLEASFGPNVKLVSVEVETTDAPITKGVIQRYIPWVMLKKDPFYKITITNQFSQTLSQSRFTSEYER